MKYELIPAPDRGDLKEFGGAFLECWIKGSSEKDMESRAEELIKKQGWRIVKLGESYVIDTDRNYVSPESLEYCKNAEEEGECYVFHVWPVARGQEKL